ncbi:sulfurtransferase [Brachybacterium sp. AOP25-B2-12]|uniref:sulfurtransferase n=1 Tax=Brachybacterium sp. AOP25-B2-12 TaxID=3457710 RepID=UPI004034E799
MTRRHPTIAPVLESVPDGAILLDVRWSLDGSTGHATYLAGHLPGAVYVDLGTELAAPPSAAEGRHPLPAPEDFAASMRRAGLHDDSLVVAYDDTDGSQASRLVWMLRALGVEAALLDGGLRGVIGVELSVVDERPEPGTFTARAWDVEVVATPDEVASGHFLVIDARAPERYRGATEPIDPRAGHVPGALNVPFAGNVDGDGRFLPVDALRERFTAAGVDPEDEVIVYCGSGVTATHNLLALERAGLVGARLLPGSWSQWSADPTREVATGSAP